MIIIPDFPKYNIQNIYECIKCNNTLIILAKIHKRCSVYDINFYLNTYNIKDQALNLQIDFILNTLSYYIYYYKDYMRINTGLHKIYSERNPTKIYSYEQIISIIENDIFQ